MGRAVASVPKGVGAGPFASALRGAIARRVLAIDSVVLEGLTPVCLRGVPSWPVQEVQIEVVGAEALERTLQISDDVLRRDVAAGSVGWIVLPCRSRKILDVGAPDA